MQLFEHKFWRRLVSGAGDRRLIAFFATGCGHSRRAGGHRATYALPPAIELLEDRFLLEAAPVYFHASVQADAGIYTAEGGAPIASDNNRSGFTPSLATGAFGSVSLLSSVSFGGAQASAQASVSTEPGKISGSASQAGTKTLKPDGSVDLFGSGYASAGGAVLIGAELGSEYKISVSGDPFWGERTLEGMISPNPGGYPLDTPGLGVPGYDGYTGDRWWLIENPGPDTPPKLAYGVPDGGVSGVTINPDMAPDDESSFSISDSFSVSVTAEHTPPPPGDIVALYAWYDSRQDSSFWFTYGIDENPVAPFRVDLYASEDSVFDPAKDIRISMIDLTGNIEFGMIDNWIVAPNLRTVGEHTIRITLPGSVDSLLPEGYSFFAVADGTNHVRETNEFNNIVPRNPILGVVTHGWQPWLTGHVGWVDDIAEALKGQGYDRVVTEQWADESNHLGAGVTESVGVRLMTRLVEVLQEYDGPVDVHLIGHSRGAVVISQAFDRTGVAPGERPQSRLYADDSARPAPIP